MRKKHNPENLLLKDERFVEWKKEEECKSEPEKTIAERIKLKHMKKSYLTRHCLLLIMILMNLLISRS